MNIKSLYLPAYSGLLVGSSLLDLGFRAYSAKVDDSSSRIGLAVSRSLHNLAFVMPVAWLGYRIWKFQISQGDPLTMKLLKAVCTAFPSGVVIYIFIGLAANPIVAQLRSKGPKDVTPLLTPHICNLFRVLNTVAVTITLAQGRISRLSACLALSACIATGVAQYLQVPSE